MTRPFPSGSTSMSPRSATTASICAPGSAASGLTLACGTGACATAVAAIVQKKVASPVKVHMRGGDADHQLGAGRADPHARRRDPCVQGRDRPGAVRLMGARRSPSAAGSTSPRARRCARSPATMRSSSTAARSPTRRCARPARRSAAPTARRRTSGSSSPAARRSSIPRALRRCRKWPGHRQCRQISAARRSSRRAGASCGSADLDSSRDDGWVRNFRQ